MARAKALGWVVWRLELSPVFCDRCRSGEGFSSLHPLRRRRFSGAIHAPLEHQRAENDQTVPALERGAVQELKIGSFLKKRAQERPLHLVELPVISVAALLGILR